MPSLHDIQSALMHDIYTGERTSAQYLADTKAGDPDRLDIYFNNNLLILTEFLATVYPVVVQLVGEEFFKTVCRHYIPAHPQPSGDLQKCGAQMSAFLSEFEPAENHPYLADIAALEWANYQATTASDAVPISFDKLTHLASSGQDVHLKLHPSAQLLPLSYNAADIWQAHQNLTDDSNIELKQEAHTLLVARNSAHEIFFKRLSAAETLFLEALSTNKTFADAMNAVAQAATTDEDITQFQQDFAALITAEVLTE